AVALRSIANIRQAKAAGLPLPQENPAPQPDWRVGALSVTTTPLWKEIQDMLLFRDKMARLTEILKSSRSEAEISDAKKALQILLGGEEGILTLVGKGR